MADVTRSLIHKDYTVGWICALPVESVAAKAMLDERHDTLPSHSYDQNTYALGRIGNHNIAIACLPKYQVGTNSAAVVSTTMRFTFPSIRFGLMVGIGGGVPNISKKKDIRLGDVVVSTPAGVGTGVIQYDMGKMEREGQFRRTGALSKPPTILLGAISSLETTYGLEKQLSECISDGFDKWYPEWASTYAYQGTDYDQLFQADYDHVNDEDDTCQQCDILKIITTRSPRGNSFPVIHYGNIASGNLVMKHGTTRDQLAEQEDIKCFEMEAAGLVDNFPCLVIRGICDYADSHKNKTWQPYAAAVAAAYAKTLLLVIAPQVVKEMVPIQNNLHWLVPRQVNTLFTGRKEILQTLHEKIYDTSQEERPRQQRFVIVGMGGIGKSEVCLKFAEDVRDRFRVVFWIDASSEASLERGFTDIANKIKLQDQTLDGAKWWLANTEQSWLCIMDNADNRKIDYAKYFPSGRKGSIIITTRNQECLSHNTVGHKTLDRLELEDAITLLLKASGVNEDLWQIQQDTAKEVVDTLGLHALAIVQGGAFIRKGLCSLEEYPHEFRRQRQRLLRFRPEQAQSIHGDVYATFEASARVLEESSDPQDSDALELLAMLAFLHFDSVPELLFTKAWDYAREISKGGEERSRQDTSTIRIPRWHRSRFPRFMKSWDYFRKISKDSKKESHQDITTLSRWHRSRFPGFMRQSALGDLDIISLRLAAEVLASFSLITVNQSHDISMHPLVHAWANDRLKKSDQKATWISTVSTLVLSTERYGYYQPFWRRLQSHVETCVDLRPNDCFNENYFGISQVFYSLGWFLHEMYRDSKAELLLSLTLENLGSKFTEPSETRMKVKRLMAICLINLGQYRRAINLLEEVIEIQKTTLAPEHPRRLASQHELARAYLAKGQYQRAIELLEEVVKIKKTTLAPEDSRRLASQHELARAYLENGQYQRAIELLEEVVKIKKTTLAPEHPHRLVSQQELARAYLENGQDQRAIELLEEVVEIEKTTLAPEHPRRLASQHELARAYLDNGQDQRAIELLEEVVEIEKTTLAPEDPRRLASQHELARAYLDNGQYQRAIELLEEVIEIEIKKTTLAPEDPRRLVSQHVLARAYLKNGQDQRAIELLEEVVEIQKTTLAPEHPRRLVSQHELARAYLAKGQYQRAIELLEEVVEIEKTTLAPEDPQRLASQHVLARAYLKKGQDQRAIEPLEEVLEIRKTTLALRHPRRLA